PRIKGRVRAVRGGVSGGTVASLKATLAAAARRPALFRLLADPFALSPGFKGPAQPSTMLPYWDAAVGAWVAPFIMAPINTKNVHRTNYLLGHPYGTDFQYDEMIVARLGDLGVAAVRMLAKANPFASLKGPEPGEGPSRDERESGFFDILFVAEMPDQKRLRLVVRGDRDPGYLSARSGLTLVAADKQFRGLDAHAADPESLRDGARTLPAARISRTLSTGTDGFRPL
ncbi:MAG: hypothetical protein ACJ8DY_06185, partial [Xanthobacteraceae bacterium]